MYTFGRLGMATAAAVLVLLFLMGFGIPDPEPSPTPPSAAATPSIEPPASTRALATARRWPATGLSYGSEYRPGLYYWSGSPGWMHNASQDVGPGEGVSIRFNIVANGYVEGPTAITVAGHDGTQREVLQSSGVRREVSLVEIEGRNVMIVLERQPQATPEEVAEARAIIASIQYEPSDSVREFRLVFWIPAGWDSG